MRGLFMVWKVYLALWIALRLFTLGTRLLFHANLQNVIYFFLCIVSVILLTPFMIGENYGLTPIFCYFMVQAFFKIHITLMPLMV